MSRRRHCTRKRITREELTDRVNHLRNLHDSSGAIPLFDTAQRSSAECFELQVDDFVARCEAQLRYAKLLQADVRGMEELAPAIASRRDNYEFVTMRTAAYPYLRT